MTEVHEALAMARCAAGDAERPILEQFIRTVFRRTYDAAVEIFCPELLAYSHDSRLRAVVGYRDGLIRPLFSEHYLDAPAERLMSERLGRPVLRHELVEVGNLALAHPGQARWLIAATTAFLHAAGYRWVLFTAVTPLFNAFARLGLRPVSLARADPHRLPDAGRAWGSYYAARPVVYAGDIAAGMGKLAATAAQGRPDLKALMSTAQSLGAAARHGVWNAGVLGGTG